MFRRKDALYEARIADLKEAHQAEVRALMKVIDSLAEQIEYLRATFGRPLLANARPSHGLAWQGPEGWAEQLGVKQEDLPLHISEEEEDLLALRENNLITDEELAAMRTRLGLDT